MVRLIVRQPGLLGYNTAWRQMVRFTDERDDESCDECWRVEHPPVFTLGLAGKQEHILDRGKIPVIHSDRGGQVTYHGPGQLVVYLMIDLKRKGLGVKDYVHGLEQALIACLAGRGIAAGRVEKAPGVYVDGKKIAALGIRVKRGCSYHGIALNVDPDLAPFSRINPCGYPGMEVTSLCELGCRLDTVTVFNELLPYLLAEFDYSESESRPAWHMHKSRAA